MFIRALPGDNFHLPEAYIENLKRADKVTRERLLEGNFEYDADPMKIMRYDAITDLPFNTINGDDEKYLIADIARFGGDKIVLATFIGLQIYSLGVYTYQGTDATVLKIKDESRDEHVPFHNILIDEDGIGGGVMDQLPGIKGFIGNSRPLDLVEKTSVLKQMPSNFTNLRSQCFFKLADMVNTRSMAVKVVKFKTNIEGYTLEMAISDMMEELDVIKQKDTTTSDTKKAIISKEQMKETLGRSPDFADTMSMRMWFELQKREVPFNRQITIMRNMGRPTTKPNHAE
jgi:phage terminase large subunit